MSIENFGGFKTPQPAAEQSIRPSEKLQGTKKTLWEKTKALLSQLGLDMASQASLETEKEIVSKVKEIRNNNEDDKFLDLEIERAWENLNLRTVAQIDPKYDPERKKNYNKWDLTPQEEAERWLNREILVAEKMDKFFVGESVSADELIAANRDPKAGAMYLLKRTKEQGKEQEDYSQAEGRALAVALLSMQEKLDATGMVKEIMSENGIETKLEMEQKIFEDYFDHFDGYIENSKGVLEDLGDEDAAERLEARMEKYRAVIEDRQLGEDEFSFVHGNINFETIRYSENGRAYLADWQRAGKTQNKELSLVYDLGNAMQAAVEGFEDVRQVEAYIGGIESGIREYYKDQPEVAEAVINLTKLRSFAMIVNDLEGEKKDLVLKGLGEGS